MGAKQDSRLEAAGCRPEEITPASRLQPPASSLQPPVSSLLPPASHPALITFALLSGCFALAVTVEPQLAVTQPYVRHEQSPVEVILGDARRFFAGHFFVKADVYFHSGYYPSIFDQSSGHHDAHIATDADAVGREDKDDDDDFLGKPRDWIDAFSRSFYPSIHTHLDEVTPNETDRTAAAGKVREMLPWLRITAALDPNRIETYTVGAYWLRTRMNKPEQAEAFLREGLKANPRSYAILFELGRICHESYRDPDRARNLWEAALKRWNQVEATRPDLDNFLLAQITWHLAMIEQQAGNLEKAIAYLKIAKTASPAPDQVQQRIDELVPQTQPAQAK